MPEKKENKKKDLKKSKQTKTSKTKKTSPKKNISKTKKTSLKKIITKTKGRGYDESKLKKLLGFIKSKIIPMKMSKGKTILATAEMSTKSFKDSIRNEIKEMFGDISDEEIDNIHRVLVQNIINDDSISIVDLPKVEPTEIEYKLFARAVPQRYKIVDIK